MNRYMNRDIKVIAKEIDWFYFLFKLNFYNLIEDLDVKTWDDVVLKFFPKIGLFDSTFFENKQLTSLKGCPKEFSTDFNCRNNKLTSLEGAPEKVGGNFWCSENNNLPEYKIKAYKAYLNLSDSEKAPLTKDGHYYPTKKWEKLFVNKV